MESTNDKGMIHEFYQQHEAVISGILGIVVGAVLPIMNEWLEFAHKGITFCAAIGGVMLIVYSISVKQLEKEKLEMELKEKRKNKKVD